VNPGIVHSRLSGVNQELSPGWARADRIKPISTYQHRLMFAPLVARYNGISRKGNPVYADRDEPGVDEGARNRLY